MEAGRIKHFRKSGDGSHSGETVKRQARSMDRDLTATAFIRSHHVGSPQEDNRSDYSLLHWSVIHVKDPPIDQATPPGWDRYRVKHAPVTPSRELIFLYYVQGQKTTNTTCEYYNEGTYAATSR